MRIMAEEAGCGVIEPRSQAQTRNWGGMVTLKGIAYRSGNIEFGRQENEWAFARIDSELRSGQEDRIRLNPALAPVELRTCSDQAEHQLPWLESFQRTIQSAEAIYLQKHDGYLRFRKAIHPAGNNRRYITLSGQEEVDTVVGPLRWREQHAWCTATAQGDTCEWSDPVAERLSHKLGSASQATT